MRNHMPAATALDSAASRFTRMAIVGAIGSRVNTRPMSTKKGFPGGCGMPIVYAAAIYSLVSHMAVSGESVSTYNANTSPAAMAAAAYEGRESSSGWTLFVAMGL